MSGSLDPSADIAAWWRAHPAPTRLRARLDRAAVTDVAATLDAVREMFADAGWPGELVAALTRRMAGDTLFEPPFRVVESDANQGLLIVDDPRVMITLSRISLERLALGKIAARGPRVIGFSGQYTLMRVVRAGGAVLRLWDAAPAGEDFDPISAPPCRPAGEMALADGMTLLIDGRSRSYAIERAAGDVVLIQAAIHAARGPLLIEYDAATLAFAAASAVDGATSRMQLMSAFLAATGREDAREAITGLLDDNRFFVRWQAMRALVSIDPEGAAARLETMARTDRHPAVRTAAGRTLGRIPSALAERRAAPDDRGDASCRV
jgi:hypothetical protein